MGLVERIGTRAARFARSARDDPAFRLALTERLAERDDALLAAYLEGDAAVSDRRLRSTLVEHTRRADLHPVFFGAAITGTGVEALIDGIAQLLPQAQGDPDGPLAGRVFKIERTASGKRVAYVRLFSGTLRVRERVPYGRGAEDRVTAVSVFAPGGAVQRASAAAGEIAYVSGLVGVRVGDGIGDLTVAESEHHFPPPTLESVVVPRNAAYRGRLAVALTKQAEQDPLINLRRNDTNGEISVSLYGDVQKEVIGATLARDYGVEVDFRESTTIYVERPVGTGEALEVLRAATHSNVTGKSSPHSTNPFLATLGLRIEAAPVDSGLEMRRDVDVRLVPLYIYKTVERFVDAMTTYVREALQQGLFGWEVIDARVKILDCGYRAPGTTAADFHRLTALVLARAIERARTQVCEPMALVHLELPTDAMSQVLPLLARLGGRVKAPVSDGELSTIEALVAARLVDDLRRALPAATGGEGVLQSRFGGYEPVGGTPPPARGRSTPNPLNRRETASGRALAR
jgi:ribosomal protection tetracycline resistance protein